MRPLDTILHQLPNAKPYGHHYRATCPVHQRTTRQSLSICEADDGRVLLHCFGGCDTRDIVEALGLRWSDLFTTPLAVQRPARRRYIHVDPDRLKNRARKRISASVLYAALWVLAVLNDRLPAFTPDERLGCYVGLCEELWTVVLTDGTDAAREAWQSWQADLRHTAPMLLAMMERICP